MYLGFLTIIYKSSIIHNNLQLSIIVAACELDNTHLNRDETVTEIGQKSNNNFCRFLRMTRTPIKCLP